MLNFFRKKEGLKIYGVRVYSFNGYNNREYQRPKGLEKIKRGFPPLFITKLFLSQYLKTNPSRYENYNLAIKNERLKARLDVEWGGPEAWYVSQRFKDFCLQENLPFDFFPIMIEGERRYITMWRNLPVITDYEVDNQKTTHSQKGYVDMSSLTFRSDFIEYSSYQIFSETDHIYIYITDSLKQKLEANNFKFSFKGPNWKTESYPVTQKKLNPEKLKKELIYAREMERKLYLTKEQYEKLQAVDDFLEKALIADQDQKALARFRAEMKGVWKKDFERFEKGLMQPLERITYW